MASTEFKEMLALLFQTWPLSEYIICVAWFTLVVLIVAPARYNHRIRGIVQGGAFNKLSITGDMLQEIAKHRPAMLWLTWGSVLQLAVVGIVYQVVGWLNPNLPMLLMHACWLGLAVFELIWGTEPPSKWAKIYTGVVILYLANGEALIKLFGVDQ